MSSTSSPSPDPALTAGRVGQLLAGLGATLALLGPFAVWLSGIGVFILVLGVVVAAPVASYRGPFMANWWTVIALAALACLIGFGLGFLVAWIGGLLLVAGAVAALVAVGLGTPAKG